MQQWRHSFTMSIQLACEKIMICPVESVVSDRMSFQVSWRTMAGTGSEHEVITNCCFTDYVGGLDVKYIEREEVQSVIRVGRCSLSVIIHTATRESLLCCPGRWSAGPQSLPRTGWVSIISLRLLYPGVFTASLSCVLLPLTHKTEQHSTERRNTPTDRFTRKCQAIFFMKQNSYTVEIQVAWKM